MGRSPLRLGHHRHVRRCAARPGHGAHRPHGRRLRGAGEVASAAQRDGYAYQADATALLTDGAAGLGLTARPVEASEPAVRRQINSGFPVVCAVQSSAFGNGTAYIVLTDIDERGRLVVNDPASVDRTERHWDFEEILPSSTGLWAYSVAG